MSTKIMKVGTPLKDPLISCRMASSTPDRDDKPRNENGLESDTSPSSKTPTSRNSSKRTIHKTALSQESSDTAMDPVEESQEEESGTNHIKNHNDKEDHTRIRDSASRISMASASVSASTGTVDTNEPLTSQVRAPVVTTPTLPSKKSLSSTINMDSIDEEDALERLLHDLSEDEVSMMIGLFGKDLDIGPTRQQDLRLPTDSHGETKDNETRNCDSVSASVLPENLPPASAAPPHPSQDKETALAGSAAGGKLPLPRSLFLNYNPAIHGSHFFPPAGLAQLMSLNSLTQEAIHALHAPLYQTVVPILPLQVLGSPQTLAKEPQAMANKRGKEILGEQTKVSDSCNKSSSCPAPLLQQRAHATREALPNKASDVTITATANATKRKRRRRSGARKKAATAAATTEDAATGATKKNAAAAASTAAPATTSVGKKAKAVKGRRKKTKAKRPKPAATHTIAYISNPSKQHEERWSEYLEKAIEFVSKHGNCHIPTTYLPDPDLANWAKRQRYHFKIYKKHVLDRPLNPAIVPAQDIRKYKELGVNLIKCLMTPERIQKLEAIGFCLDLQAGSWDRMYERLCDYVKLSNGKTCPSEHDDFKLWKWVGTQRYNMKLLQKKGMDENPKPSDLEGIRTHLTPERIAKLNQINFAWRDPQAREQIV